MPLRELQKLEFFGAGEIKYKVSRIDEQTGYVESVDVSQNIALPDKSKTDLAKMLKAGVPMQQQRCNLLDPVQVVVDEFDEQGDQNAEQ